MLGCQDIRCLRLRGYFLTLGRRRTPKLAGSSQGGGGARCYKIENLRIDGGKNYLLRLNPNSPVKQFWSVTLYDNEPRCFIDNKEEIADRSSRMDLLKNADGSVDLYFGPKASQGKEKNWVPTVPGKGWFCYFRLSAPQRNLRLRRPSRLQRPEASFKNPSNITGCRTRVDDSSLNLGSFFSSAVLTPAR